MTAADPSDPPKLAAFASVIGAYRNVLSRPRALAKLAALPVFATIAILYVIETVPQLLPGSGFLFLGSPVLLLAYLGIPLSYFSLVWLRCRMLGRSASILIGSPWIGALSQSIAYFVLGFVWFLLTPRLAVYAYTPIVLLLPAEAAPGIEGLPLVIFWLGLSVSSLYLTARLFLAVPAIAAGFSGSPVAAWRTSTGSGGQLFRAFLLLVLSFLVVGVFSAYVADALEGLLAVLPRGSQSQVFGLPAGFYTSAVVTALGLVGSTAVLSEFLAAAFRQMMSRKSPNQDILKRFE
ncbi:hypothetical protein [Pelagibius sp.]|uniref:hypothetical protein n=1 Tax=Pelagibius sp. TaxID=1931238 RepID=UPI00261D7019|nr:hypothetical protein [Pelagibius sp.]